MDEDEHTISHSSEIVRLEPTELSPTGDEKHRLLMQTLSEAQVDFLLQRTPKREIKMRQGRGGLQFAYVEHGYVTERLNLVFGFNWDFEVVDKQILEDEVIVEARLTVRTPNGQTIVKTQFGGADIKRHSSGARSGRPVSIADDYKAAASDALKKCASLLGIGLDLYGRDRPAENDAESPTSERKPSDTAKVPAPSRLNVSPNGFCTPSQSAQIQRLAKQAKMDLDTLCANLEVEDLAQLTEARAQRVINRLEKLARDSWGVEAS
jgi:hypothetical protein